METFQAVIFDSHDAQFRSPQGAIPRGQSLTLRILVHASLSAYGVTLRLWENNCERLLNLTRTNFFSHTPYGDFLEEYSINVSRETSGLSWYYFIINTPSKPLYCLNNQQMLGGAGEICDRPYFERSFQITTFDEDFSVPAWAKGAVMYQIFPDRFNRHEKFGDVSGRRVHESWLEEPDYLPDEKKGYYAADDFFGGNLRGIQDKLDYLKSLNVDVLYLNPVFESYSNHRYDTGDYEKIDRTLGTNKDFENLCHQAKKRGIRVILDGVFSHTGSDSRYFNRENNYEELGAYQSADSPYYSWYDFEQFPDKYDCWWGVWSLPCVKELNESYKNYILTDKNSIVKKWLRCGASGWRLDVADELPDEFLRILRKSVKEEDSDALILGEVWEDASNKVSYNKQREFLFGSELDTVMNYPLRNAIIDFLTGAATGEDFCRRVLSLRENYPRDTFYSLMNFLSTHDSERILTRFFYNLEGKTKEEQASVALTHEQRILAKALHKLGALLIFALPGMMCIYYGDEAGLEGGKDPFNRKPYPWGKEDKELLSWYKTLTNLRDKTFRLGELSLSCQGSLLNIVRTLDKEKRYVLINPCDETVETLLDSTYFTSDPEILCSSVEGLQISQRENGWYLLMPAFSGAVFATR
ncbi:MAG: glycoside hydrolase family 13 protein [Clostridia bacterium]|nr:glycoside hydrolase family 13 protein [Clostridia bacterium]